MRFTFATLLVCCTSTLSLVAAETSGPNLKDLCEGKDEAQISRLSHIESLADQLDSKAEPACPGNVREAIRQLDVLVSDRLACSMKKANKIVELYDEFFRDDPNNENQVKLKPLVDFFIAYGLKVSAICRRHMMDTFLRHTKDTLSVSELDELDDFVDSNSAINRLLVPLTEPGEILLPSDVTAFLTEANQELLYVGGSSADKLRRAKSICELRLQPLYEESVLPLAVLAKAGFSFRTILERGELWLLPGAFLEMRNWANMIFFCESLRTVRIGEPHKGAKKCNIELETHENGQLTTKTVSRPAKLRDNEPVPDNPLERVDRYVSPVKIGDKIIGKYDFQLKKAVESFDLTQSLGPQRLAKLFLDSSLKILLAKIKSGQYEEAFKTFLSRIGGCKDDPDLEVVKGRLVDVIKTKKIGAIYGAYQLPYLLFKLVQLVVFWLGAAPLIPASHMAGKFGDSARGKIVNEFKYYQY